MTLVRMVKEKDAKRPFAGFTPVCHCLFYTEEPKLDITLHMQPHKYLEERNNNFPRTAG